MGLNVCYHFGPVVVSFDQGMVFSIPKWPKWLSISWRIVLIRDLRMTVALHSLPFSLVMWNNRPLSSYPYESLSWNLLLGSSINLAILMQFLSDCCKAFLSVNSASHNGQQSSPTLTWFSFMETSSSFRGLLFLFLITKGSQDKQLAALILWPGMCST